MNFKVQSVDLAAFLALRPHGLASAALAILFTSQSCLADSPAEGCTRDQAEPVVKLAAWTKGKQKMTLRIQGPNTWVRGVFGVRVMKAAENP